MKRIQWIAQVACEYGGPAIIADAADYEQWMGATAYPLEKRSVLHYWGQFTDELPAPYAQDGGHVYRKAGNLEALREQRDALIAAVESKFTGADATVDEEEGEAHILLPDGRQMWIEFGPKSQYEEACEGEGPVWRHVFQTPSGREGQGLFWDKEGPGDFFVGMNDERDELLLLRTWVDDDEFEDTAKAFVDAVPPAEEPAPDSELVVRDGRIVVAYSPHTWLSTLGGARLGEIMTEVSQAGLSKEEGLARLETEFRAKFAHSEGHDVTMLCTDDDNNIAAVVSLVPGTYLASFGRYDPDDAGEDGESGDDDDDDTPSWSCIWCRLKLSR